MGGRKKTFGPDGLPEPYKPHSKETKQKMREAAIDRINTGKWADKYERDFGFMAINALGRIQCNLDRVGAELQRRGHRLVRDQKDFDRLLEKHGLPRGMVSSVRAIALQSHLSQKSARE